MQGYLVPMPYEYFSKVACIRGSCCVITLFMFMKRIIYLLSLVLVTVNAAWADNISVEQAIGIAQQFANHDATTSAQRRVMGKRVEPRLAHAVKSKSSQQDNVYVINLGDDQGFVIVAGDDGADAEVLGYCDHGTFEYDKAPVQLKDMLAN